MSTRRKLVIDQDAHGPASTNLQSLLMLLAADDVEVLGIGVVSGDGWCAENTAHLLRLLEIAGRVSLAEGFAEEERVIKGLIGSPNQVEAVRAFFEKRPPAFADPT